MNKFVLIGGMPRSGTNLTRRIVGSHSSIAIPTAEFQFFREYRQGKSVRQILANEKLQDWGVEFSDLYEQPPSQVYVTVLSRYAEKVGKKISGEKSPRNEFYLDLAEEWLENLQFKCIIMMRNPLDVVASYKFIPGAQGKKEKDTGLVYRSAQEWLRSITIALAKRYAKPESYFLLRYEDLVAGPHAQTRALCDFIGVDFEESRMLSLSDFAEHKDNTSFGQQQNIQQTYRVYQPESRKHFLSDDEIMVVQDVCGELAWAVGYQDESFEPVNCRTRERESAMTKPQLNKLRRWSRSLFSH